MFCKYCGHENAENAKFCTFCGESTGFEEHYLTIVQPKPKKQFFEKRTLIPLIAGGIAVIVVLLIVLVMSKNDRVEYVENEPDKDKYYFTEMPLIPQDMTENENVVETETQIPVDNNKLTDEQEKILEEERKRLEEKNKKEAQQKAKQEANTGNKDGEKSNHTHTYDEDWQVREEATCTKNGLRSRECKSCETGRETEVIVAEGHKYVTTASTSATCTTAGSEEKTCSVCGHKETKNIPATGNHNYVTENGKKTCSVCGHTKSDGNAGGNNDVQVLECNHPSVVYEETKVAICGVNGEMTRTCTVCGDKKTTTTPATGDHYFIKEASVFRETCTRQGVDIVICIYCGQEEDMIIPPTGHDFEITESGEVTCQSNKTITKTCKTCGHIETETISNPDVHQVAENENQCSLCGIIVC